MPYKNESIEETITRVRRYVRSHKAIVSNPLSGGKGIRYDEEGIREETDQDGKVTVYHEGYKGSLEQTIDETNADTEFDLYHPVTGDPLGAKAKFGDVQTPLYSLYFHISE